MTVEDRIKRAILSRSLRRPRRLRRLIAGSPRINDRGQILDEELHWMLELERCLSVPLVKETAAEARASLRSGVEIVQRRSVQVAEVGSLTVAGRPARRYRDGAQPAPLMAWFHGGGWTAGDLDSHDILCGRVCADTGWVVVSVDYRFAPEHPFPAGLEDVAASIVELRRRAVELGGDPERLVAGGDSAGGNLTAAACIDLRDAGAPLPALQVLLYPGTDLRRLDPSHRLFGEGFLLTTASIDWYLEQYRADELEPRASVTLAQDLAGLPPALVLTAGFDPLRDEGERFAQQLRGAGVPVVHLDASGLVHGFAHMGGVLPAADREVGRLIGGMIAALEAAVPTSP